MKKKINVLLIFVLISIWGYVAVRTFSSYFLSSSSLLKNNSKAASISIGRLRKDTFSLGHINRDPFLNIDNYIQKDTASKAVIKSPVRPRLPETRNTPPKEIYNWPSIYYYGYLSPKGKNTEILVLLKINDRIRKVKVNQKVEDIAIHRVYKDSVELDYNGLKKVFIINEDSN